MAYNAAMQEEFADDEPTDDEWYAELERNYWLDVSGAAMTEYIILIMAGIVAAACGIYLIWSGSHSPRQ